MDASSVGAVAAVVAVLVTIMGGAFALIYSAGKHSQRLDTHQKQIEKLEATTDEHAKAIGAWDQAVKLLEEVRKDVKGLLAGRGVQGRRRADDES